jgi:hypothetical protein
MTDDGDQDAGPASGQPEDFQQLQLNRLKRELAHYSAQMQALLEGYYSDYCLWAEARGRPVPSEPVFWWEKIIAVPDWSISRGEALSLWTAAEHHPDVKVPTAELLDLAQATVLMIRRQLLRPASEERKIQGWADAVALLKGSSPPPPLAKRPGAAIPLIAAIVDQPPTPLAAEPPQPPSPEAPERTVIASTTAAEPQKSDNAKIDDAVEKKVVEELAPKFLANPKLKGAPAIRPFLDQLQGGSDKAKIQRVLGKVRRRVRQLEAQAAKKTE